MVDLTLLAILSGQKANYSRISTVTHSPYLKSVMATAKSAHDDLMPGKVL